MSAYMLGHTGRQDYERYVILTLRTTAEIRAALVQAAQDDRRPLAPFIELVLVRWLEEHGHLPAPKGGKR